MQCGVERACTTKYSWNSLHCPGRSAARRGGWSFHREDSNQTVGALHGFLSFLFPGVYCDAKHGFFRGPCPQRSKRAREEFLSAVLRMAQTLLGSRGVGLRGEDGGG